MIRLPAALGFLLTLTLGLVWSEPAAAQWGLFGGQGQQQNQQNNNNNNGWGGGNQNNRQFNNNNGWNGQYNSGGCSGGLHRRMSYNANKAQCNCGNPPGLETLIPGLIQALTPPPGSNNPPPQYDRPQYNRPPRYTEPRYVEPRYVAPRPVPQVKPKANKKAPEKVVSSRKNAKFNLGIVPISPAQHSLAQQLTQVQSEKAASDMTNMLGNAANDPQVAAQLDVIEQKIASGQAVTQQDIDTLKGLVANAGGGTNATAAELDTQAGKLIGLSEANAALSTPFPPGGIITTIPTGPANVVFMPGMPAEEVVMLPGGAVMVGTGGEGSIGVESADLGDVLGLPVGVGEPVPESDEEVAKRVKSGVLLLNPAENEVPIEYVVANHNYTMQSGFSQTLPDTQSWVISFDRGEGQGEAKYTLASGSYAFGSSERGWDLFARKFKVTIDNSRSEDPFLYVVDNTHAEVPAGETKTHNSNYPILVRFDRGDGGKEAKKRISRDATTLIVAVSPSDGFWDLFPADNFDPADVAQQADEPRKTKPGRRAADLLKAREKR